MANYILWGKNADGLNGRQEGLDLETRFKTWDTTQVESLDALIEDPAFNEASLRPDEPPTFVRREVLSRSRIRRTAPPEILTQFEKLWKQIDLTDFEIEIWELAHGKRSAPIRPALISALSEAEQSQAIHHSESLSLYGYLKLRHYLVDLRREQYSFKDSFVPVVRPHTGPQITEYKVPTFDADVIIKPMGLPFKGDLSKKIFRADRFPEPDDFAPSELKALSRFLWGRKPEEGQFVINFCDENQLYEIYGMAEELRDAAQNPDQNVEATLPQFVELMEIYKKLANLGALLEDILEMKARKASNQVIADYINKTYQKTYRPNYISTLYCKKCLGKIAEVARTHREICENLSFPENFKKCKDCGRVFLRNEENFVKRARASDGFSPRCKECEKILREKGKQK